LAGRSGKRYNGWQWKVENFILQKGTVRENPKMTKQEAVPPFLLSRDANLTRSAIAAFHDTIKSYDFVE
jgi:hypothetical protein